MICDRFDCISRESFTNVIKHLDAKPRELCQDDAEKHSYSGSVRIESRVAKYLFCVLFLEMPFLSSGSLNFEGLFTQYTRSRNSTWDELDLSAKCQDTRMEAGKYTFDTRWTCLRLSGKASERYIRLFAAEFSDKDSDILTFDTNVNIVGTLWYEKQKNKKNT